MAEKLRGNSALAIIVAVYDNCHYDYALLQMKYLLTRQGFVMVGADTFVAEHSIFLSVGTGWPVEKDKEAMTEFSKTCKRLLQR